MTGSACTRHVTLSGPNRPASGAADVTPPASHGLPGAAPRRRSPTVEAVRPVIAVTGRLLDPDLAARRRHPSVSSPRTYSDALHRAGALDAVLLPVPMTEDEAAERLAHFSGLLLTGGPDVDPHVYGEEPHPAVYGVHRPTDDTEIALARAAVRDGVPTLAI